MLGLNSGVPPSVHLLPRRPFDLTLRLQLEEIISAARRNQNQPATTANAHPGAPTQDTPPIAQSTQNTPAPFANPLFTQASSPHSCEYASIQATCSGGSDRTNYTMDSSSSICDSFFSDSSSQISSDAETYAPCMGAAYIAPAEGNERYVWSWVRWSQSILEHMEAHVKLNIERAQKDVPFDCFPVKYRNLREEQKRHSFFWRFGPEAYVMKYVNIPYIGSVLNP